MRNNIASTVVIVLLIVVSMVSFGQEGFKVGISMGSVLPMGDFKSNGTNSLKSGYSENGFALNFDGDYFLHHRLAISGRFHFEMTSIDEPAFIKRLETDPILSSYISTDSTKNLYTINNWQWSAPMVGLKYNYPIIVNKIYVETGIFSGFSITQIPDQNLIIDDKANEQTIISENVGHTSISVPVMADLGFRIILNENIQLKLSSSYYQSKANYLHANFIVKNNTSTIYKELGNINFSVPVKTLNLNVGLVYTL